jgi:hypothetical protein
MKQRAQNQRRKFYLATKQRLEQRDKHSTPVPAIDVAELLKNPTEIKGMIKDFLSQLQKLVNTQPQMAKVEKMVQERLLKNKMARQIQLEMPQALALAEFGAPTEQPTPPPAPVEDEDDKSVDPLQFPPGLDMDDETELRRSKFPRFLSFF